MSGNASRKYKQYKLMLENRNLFGDISQRNEYGNMDLVPMYASKGKVMIKKNNRSTGKAGVF